MNWLNDELKWWRVEMERQTERISRLNHESFDDTMDEISVVVTVSTVNAEILHCLWTSTETNIIPMEPHHFLKSSYSEFSITLMILKYLCSFIIMS